MLKDLFTKNKKKKYATIPSDRDQQDVPEGLMTKCSGCKKIMYTKELQKNHKVCIHCGFHHQMTAYERIESLFEPGSFTELDRGMLSVNPLDFPDYLEKLEKDKRKANMNETVVTGTGEIEGYEVAVAVMDSHFRMGSMGSVVGEKITRRLKKLANYTFHSLFSQHQEAHVCKKAF